MSNSSNVTAHYADVFKVWPTNLLGPKPTAEMLQSIHQLNARPGKQALACAMALRDKGVTAGQIVIACGAPQLNKMRGFITDALLKRVAAPKSSEGHTVYKLELTAKGKQRIERNTKLEAKAVEAGKGETADKPVTKAKGASKPRKAKVAPATVDGTVEAASATVGTGNWADKYVPSQVHGTATTDDGETVNARAAITAARS